MNPTPAELQLQDLQDIDRLGDKTLPVVEVFGPTVQGEGFLAGLPTHFVRTGLCDYRCTWCDSMHAVDPARVKASARRLTAKALSHEVWKLGVASTVPWVTISGGNPAIHDCAKLVEALHLQGFKVSVETQGSRWTPWLLDIDHLTISPKPPSSGMHTQDHMEHFAQFMAHLWTSVAYPSAFCSLKVVVFNDVDLAFARDIVSMAREDEDGNRMPTFLSVGTDPPPSFGEDVMTTRFKIGARYAWLCEAIAGDPAFANTRILPQLHAVAWGHKLGV